MDIAPHVAEVVMAKLIPANVHRALFAAHHNVKNVMEQGNVRFVTVQVNDRNSQITVCDISGRDFDKFNPN